MAFKKISSGRAGKGTLKEEGSEMEKGWEERKENGDRLDSCTV